MLKVACWGWHILSICMHVYFKCMLLLLESIKNTIKSITSPFPLYVFYYQANVTISIKILLGHLRFLCHVNVFSIQKFRNLEFLYF